MSHHLACRIFPTKAGAICPFPSCFLLHKFVWISRGKIHPCTAELCRKPSSEPNICCLSPSFNRFPRRACPHFFGIIRLTAPNLDAEQQQVRSVIRLAITPLPSESGEIEHSNRTIALQRARHSDGRLWIAVMVRLHAAFLPLSWSSKQPEGSRCRPLCICSVPKALR